jgi:hypothetical protein
MFKVKVVGQYVARSGVLEKEKIKKNYEIEGNIPTLYAALSVVKNKLLGPALAQKYPDYVTFLTYHIVEITPIGSESQAAMDKAEVNFMDRPTLIRYIKDNALQVDANYYPSLFNLREAVQYAKEDPVGYQKHFAIHEPDLRLDLEMAQCNPSLFVSDTQRGGLVASVAIPPMKTKASKPEVLAKKTGDRLGGLTADMVRDGEMGPMDTPQANTLEAGDL